MTMHGEYRCLTRPALLTVGLCAALVASPALADDPKPESKPTGATTQTTTAPSPGATQTPQANASNQASLPPEINLLEGFRSGKLAVKAEGTGDGKMDVIVTNRTHQPLRVVLPPGLVAAGTTGQFGGLGGLGGGAGGLGALGGGGMMGGMG